MPSCVLFPTCLTPHVFFLLSLSMRSSFCLYLCVPRNILAWASKSDRQAKFSFVHSPAIVTPSARNLSGEVFFLEMLIIFSSRLAHPWNLLVLMKLTESYCLSALLNNLHILNSNKNCLKFELFKFCLEPD